MSETPRYEIIMKDVEDIADMVYPAMLQDGEITLIGKGANVGAYFPQMFGMFGKTVIGVDNINPDTYDVEQEVDGDVYVFKVRTWMCKSIKEIKELGD